MSVVGQPAHRVHSSYRRHLADAPPTNPSGRGTFVVIGTPGWRSTSERPRPHLRADEHVEESVSPALPGLTPFAPHYRLALAACQAAGFRPTIAHYADEWDIGTALVAHGFGISLLPRLAPIRRDDVVRLRLSGPTAPVRRIVAVTRTGSAEQKMIAYALASITTAAEALSSP